MHAELSLSAPLTSGHVEECAASYLLVSFPRRACREPGGAEAAQHDTVTLRDALVKNICSCD